MKRGSRGVGDPVGRGHDGRVSAFEDPTAGARETQLSEGSVEADSDRLGAEFARLTGKVVGRAREGAEDIWAEAQNLRQEEPSVGRRTAVYGLAGLLRAGDALATRARGLAAQARAVQASARAASVRSEDPPGPQDVTRSPPGDGEPASPPV